MKVMQITKLESVITKMETQHRLAIEEMRSRCTAQIEGMRKETIEVSVLR